MNRRQRGFTFVELAMSMLLLSIIGIGMVMLYGRYVALDKQAETRHRLEKIRQQLLHYVQVNGYLPCPDAKGAPDGYGDRKSASVEKGCWLDHGRLPWNEIGAPATDAWGNYFYYRVNNRATSNNQVHNLCNPAGAGVFGKSGSLYFGARKPYICTSTKMIMCLTNTMRANVNDAIVCPNGDIKEVVESSPGIDQVAYVDLMFDALRWSSKTPQPSYVGLFSPPAGGYNTPASDESAHFLKVYDLDWLNPNTLTDPAAVIDQTRYSIAAQVVVVSFGARNSANIWSALTKTNGSIKSTGGSTPEYTCPLTLVTTTAQAKLQSRGEIENCDGDENFIYDQTKLIDDQLIWIDNNDIKAALIRGGKL